MQRSRIMISRCEEGIFVGKNREGLMVVQCGKKDYVCDT
jgi:hypothetical protein